MHALLIDGENVSSRHAGRIRAEVPPDCAVRHVYGDVSRLNGWLAESWLLPVHVAPARNAADIALAVDAMELALARGFAACTIATSDSGLASLVTRLRAMGRHVTVAGEAKTHASLRHAASRFVELPLLCEPATTPPPPKPAQVPNVQHSLEGFVLDLLRSANGKGVEVVALNGAIQKGPKVSISSTPERTWRAWLAARPHLFALDPRGPAARVHLARGA